MSKVQAAREGLPPAEAVKRAPHEFDDLEDDDIGDVDEVKGGDAGRDINTRYHTEDHAAKAAAQSAQDQRGPQTGKQRPGSGKLPC